MPPQVFGVGLDLAVWLAEDDPDLLLCVMVDYMEDRRPDTYFPLDRSFAHIFEQGAVANHVALEMFRFTIPEIRMIRPMFGIPDVFITERGRYRVSGDLALAILLRRMASPARYVDMRNLFGIHTSVLCTVFLEVSKGGRCGGVFP